MIRPEFWDDEKIAKLSMLAQLLYIGTWTFSDDYGVVKGNPGWLKNKIFPYAEKALEEIRNALKELEDSKRLIKFTENGEQYYYISHFLKHQTIKKPSAARNPEPPSSLLIPHEYPTSTPLVPT